MAHTLFASPPPGTASRSRLRPAQQEKKGRTAHGQLKDERQHLSGDKNVELNQGFSGNFDNAGCSIRSTQAAGLRRRGQTEGSSSGQKDKKTSGKQRKQRRRTYFSIPVRRLFRRRSSYSSAGERTGPGGQSAEVGQGGALLQPAHPSTSPQAHPLLRTGLSQDATDAGVFPSFNATDVAGILQAELSVPPEQLLRSFSSRQGTRHFPRCLSPGVGNDSSHSLTYKQPPSPDSSWDRSKSLSPLVSSSFEFFSPLSPFTVPSSAGRPSPAGGPLLSRFLSVLTPGVVQRGARTEEELARRPLSTVEGGGATPHRPQEQTNLSSGGRYTRVDSRTLYSVLSCNETPESGRRTRTELREESGLVNSEETLVSSVPVNLDVGEVATEVIKFGRGAREDTALAARRRPASATPDMTAQGFSHAWAAHSTRQKGTPQKHQESSAASSQPKQEVETARHYVPPSLPQHTSYGETGELDFLLWDVETMGADSRRRRLLHEMRLDLEEGGRSLISRAARALRLRKARSFSLQSSLKDFETSGTLEEYKSQEMNSEEAEKCNAFTDKFAPNLPSISVAKLTQPSWTEECEAPGHSILPNGGGQAARLPPPETRQGAPVAGETNPGFTAGVAAGQLISCEVGGCVFGLTVSSPEGKSSSPLPHSVLQQKPAPEYAQGSTAPGGSGSPDRMVTSSVGRSESLRRVTMAPLSRTRCKASYDPHPLQQSGGFTGCPRGAPSAGEPGFAVGTSDCTQKGSGSGCASVGEAWPAYKSAWETYVASRRGLYRQAIQEFRSSPFYRHVAGIFSHSGSLTRREMEREYIYRTACYTSSNNSQHHLPALHEAIVRLSGGTQLEVLPHDFAWAEQNAAVASRKPDEVARLSDLLEYPRMLSTLDEETVEWLDMQRTRGYWFRRVCLYILCSTLVLGSGTMEDLWLAVLEFDCMFWVIAVYLFAIFLVCMPVMAFELAAGEVIRASAPCVYRSLCKRARGLGLLMCLLIVCCECVPYSRKPAECLIYLAESLRRVQPWQLTREEIYDCDEQGGDERRCHLRSYCIFSPAREKCVPYPVGKSAVVYSRWFGYEADSTGRTPYNTMAILGSASPSAYRLHPRTEALALAVMKLPDEEEDDNSGSNEGIDGRNETRSSTSRIPRTRRRPRFTVEEDEQLKQRLRHFLKIEQIYVPTRSKKSLSRASISSTRESESQSEPYAFDFEGDDGGALVKENLTAKAPCHHLLKKYSALIERPGIHSQREFSPSRLQDCWRLKGISPLEGTRDENHSNGTSSLTSQQESQRRDNPAISQTGAWTTPNTGTQERGVDNLLAHQIRKDTQSTRRDGSEAFLNQRKQEQSSIDDTTETTWPPKNMRLHVLGAMVGAWLIASYFVIVGGSSLSIICAGALSLWLVISFGEMALNNRAFLQFLDISEFIRSEKAIQAIASPSIWTTAVLAAINDLSVGLGLFCTLGGHARIGQNIMVEASAAAITNVTASMTKFVLVASAVSFFSKTLGITAKTILQDAPVGHIFVIYPVAFFFSAPFERLTAITFFGGAAVLSLATLALQLQVIIRAVQECSVFINLKKSLVPAFLCILLPMSLPQAFPAGRLVVSNVKKYVGAVGHCWCCLGISILLGWCYGITAQSDSVGRLAVALHAFWNWLSLIGLSALWLYTESLNIFLAYSLLCPLTCAISTLVIAHYAPALQEKFEISRGLSGESPCSSATNTASIAALSLKDRMWWLLIGNVELLRLELARVVSGRATLFGFTGFWSMAIKWVAPYAMVPTIMFLSAHRLSEFTDAIHEGSTNSGCVALSMSIAFIFSGVFIYFLVKPDGVHHLMLLPPGRVLPITKLPDNLGPALGCVTWPHARAWFTEFQADACSPTATLMAQLYCAKAESLLARLRREQKALHSISRPPPWSSASTAPTEKQNLKKILSNSTTSSPGCRTPPSVASEITPSGVGLSLPVPPSPAATIPLRGCSGSPGLAHLRVLHGSGGASPLHRRYKKSVNPHYSPVGFLAPPLSEPPAGVPWSRQLYAPESDKRNTPAPNDTEIPVWPTLLPAPADMGIPASSGGWGDTPQTGAGRYYFLPGGASSTGRRRGKAVVRGTANTAASAGIMSPVTSFGSPAGAPSSEMKKPLLLPWDRLRHPGSHVLGTLSHSSGKTNRAASRTETGSPNPQAGCSSSSDMVQRHLCEGEGAEDVENDLVSFMLPSGIGSPRPRSGRTPGGVAGPPKSELKLKCRLPDVIRRASANQVAEDRNG